MLFMHPDPLHETLDSHASVLLGRNFMSLDKHLWARLECIAWFIQCVEFFHSPSKRFRRCCRYTHHCQLILAAYLFHNAFITKAPFFLLDVPKFELLAWLSISLYELYMCVYTHMSSLVPRLPDLFNVCSSVQHWEAGNGGLGMRLLMSPYGKHIVPCTP